MLMMIMLRGGLSDRWSKASSSSYLWIIFIVDRSIVHSTMRIITTVVCSLVVMTPMMMHWSHWMMIVMHVIVYLVMMMRLKSLWGISASYIWMLKTASTIVSRTILLFRVVVRIMHLMSILTSASRKVLLRWRCWIVVLIIASLLVPRMHWSITSWCVPLTLLIFVYNELLLVIVNFMLGNIVNLSNWYQLVLLIIL